MVVAFAGCPGSWYTFRCGLTPGRMPSCRKRAGKRVPSEERWYSVSGSKMAAQRYSAAPGCSNSTWRYERRASSELAMPTWAKRRGGARSARAGLRTSERG